jgi:DNA-binding transcriptional MerR regulator
MPTDNKKTQPKKEYGTVDEATQESGVSERTIRRWMAAGKLHMIHDSTGHVRVDLDDVRARAKLRSDSPLRYQVNRQQEQINDLQQQVAMLSQQIDEVRSLPERIMTLLEQMHASPDAPEAPLLIREIAGLLTRARGGRKRSATTPLEKRGLPAGTLRLVEFARLHQANLWDIKKLYGNGQIALEVKQRAEGAKRNLQEWWITPEQHHRLADYWQEHGITYEACPGCQKGATIQAS